MYKKIEEKPEAEINEIDLEELAQKVKEGYTSGRLDSETKKGTKHINWELKTLVWIE